MKKQSTPFPQSRPYMKNYFTLIKEYEKNKATVLKEEPRKPIVKIIEDIYNKYSSNLESYIQKNKGKVQLHGSTKYENASIEAFILELQSYKQTILKQIKDNPLVSANMNYQLPSEEIILTPLPDQPRKLLKEKKEKEEFDSAERTAVVMRIVEYTHRLKAEGGGNGNNNGQPRKRNQKEIAYDNRSVLIVLKKAVDVIQIWWKRMRVIKRRNMKLNRFVYWIGLYFKRRVLLRIKAVEKKHVGKMVECIDKQGEMEMMIEGNAKAIPLEIRRNVGKRSYEAFVSKRVFHLDDIEKQMKMVLLINHKVREWLIRRENRKKAPKVKVISKCSKKPVVSISYEDKVVYSFLGLILLQKHIRLFLSRTKLKRLRKEAMLKPFVIAKSPPQVITKVIIRLNDESEVIHLRPASKLCRITKQLQDYSYKKVICDICLITKEIKKSELPNDQANHFKLIYQRDLLSSMCFISKEVKQLQKSVYRKELIQLSYMTKSLHRAIISYRKELIQITSITKEVKAIETILQRQLPSLSLITKEVQPQSMISLNPISIIKLEPHTFLKVIKLNEDNFLCIPKRSIDMCHITKARICLLPKPLLIDGGINTDITTKQIEYEATKQFDIFYINLSPSINTLSYVISNHLNEYFMKAFKQFSNGIKRQRCLQRLILVQPPKSSLLLFLRKWQYNSSISSYSLTLTCNKSAFFIHDFEYKSKPIKKQSRGFTVYRTSLGFKLLPHLFYDHFYKKIQLKSNESILNDFIRLLSRKSKKELFYRLMLFGLIANSININNKPVITLLKYGLDNQYQTRLNEILRLNLTENNSLKAPMPFDTYIKELIGEEDDERDDVTIKEEIFNADNDLSRSIPDVINELYICRNANKRSITSPDTSEDHTRRNHNDFVFTPTRTANKVRQYACGSKRIFPHNQSSRQNYILLRDMNSVDHNLI